MKTRRAGVKATRRFGETTLGEAMVSSPLQGVFEAM